MKCGVKPVTSTKRTKATELLLSVDEGRRPVVITQRGAPKGVLMDVSSYQELRQATLLLRLLAQGEANVRDGSMVPQYQVFKELRGRLATK